MWEQNILSLQYKLLLNWKKIVKEMDTGKSRWKCVLWQWHSLYPESNGLLQKQQQQKTKNHTFFWSLPLCFSVRFCKTQKCAKSLPLDTRLAPEKSSERDFLYVLNYHTMFILHLNRTYRQLVMGSFAFLIHLSSLFEVKVIKTSMNREMKASSA